MHLQCIAVYVSDERWQKGKSLKQHNTLEQIHKAAKKEFLEKGYKTASLRNIVKMAGVTTGAFYGYYKSKEELFDALVEKQYQYVMEHFCEAQEQFAELPPKEQPEHLSEISGDCLLDILLYAQDYTDEFRLLLCCSEGTRYENMIDQMVEIEVDATHRYQKTLTEIGSLSPEIDPMLEHMLATGMFNTYFEMIIHQMPLVQAKNYLKNMREFYTAGWTKILTK